MTSSQKAKGNGWERECAKFLSETFGEHFNRNIAGSGNYVGGKNVFRKNVLTEEQLQFTRGDIAVPASFKNMVVECKFYKEFPFHHFLINKTIPLLNGWIDQQLDIIDENSFWFITFKVNRCGSFIVIPETLIDDLKNVGNHSIYSYKDIRFVVTEFEEFIKNHKEMIAKKCC